MSFSEALKRAESDKALLKKLRRRASRARSFPVNTCPASRHLHIMADCLTMKGGYPMLTEEPEHCAISIMSVLASLWEARNELAKLKCDFEDGYGRKCQRLAKHAGAHKV